MSNTVYFILTLTSSSHCFISCNTVFFCCCEKSSTKQQRQMKMNEENEEEEEGLMWCYEKRKKRHTHTICRYWYLHMYYCVYINDISLSFLFLLHCIHLSIEYCNIFSSNMCLQLYVSFIQIYLYITSKIWKKRGWNWMEQCEKKEHLQFFFPYKKKYTFFFFCFVWLLINEWVCVDMFFTIYGYIWKKYELIKTRFILISIFLFSVVCGVKCTISMVIVCAEM